MCFKLANFEATDSGNCQLGSTGETCHLVRGYLQHGTAHDPHRPGSGWLLWLECDVQLNC